MVPRIERRADWLAALVLLALDLSAYGQLLDPDRMLADYDAVVYFYPLRAYAAAAVQAGRLPLWNPSSFLGVPFIANPQAAFFYPGTALFFWLPVPLAYGLSLALHVLLAGLGFYAFCRVSLAVQSPAALVGAMAFMLGGVVSGQFGHLNQVSAVAWLPPVLLLADRALVKSSIRLASLAAGAFGLQFLAGHPQQSYLTAVATGLVCFWRGWPWGTRGLIRSVAVIALVAMLGASLAAVQLVPTAELTAQSIRGAGLSYREAVADSLWPWLVARALLPSYANDLGSTELLGYVGIVPLLLAVVALGVADRRRLVLGMGLVALGLGLALGAANPLYPLLYAMLPGLASFRVPARWLLLYSIGVASLAATGLDWLLRQSGLHLPRSQWLRLSATLAVLGLSGLIIYLSGVRAARSLQLVWLGLTVLGAALAVGCAWRRTRRTALLALIAVVATELWAAGGDLAPRAPVPAGAYAQPRDSTMFVQSRLGNQRLLSIASEGYELKETPDYRELYRQLPESAVVGFLVAAKRNEILTPNLNLLYRIDDVDGYDGGLLPLRRFLTIGSLLVPPDRLRPDGVLISRLESLPPRRLMDLLNLRSVLAGRAKDLEADGVDYDRSILVTLGPGARLELQRVPRRSYTALGLISSLEREAVPDGTPIARVVATSVDGKSLEALLVAGRDTAPARGEASAALSTSLTEVRPWAWTTEGDPVEYLARVDLPTGQLARLSVVNVSSGTGLNLRAMSLIDERDDAFTSLVLDDAVDRTVFFDTKVYEYPGVLGRAYLVHHAIGADDAQGLALMQREDFQPRSTAVVEPGSGLQLEPGDGSDDDAEIIQAAPELVRVRTRSRTNTLLVLSDAFYPGWNVQVDGAAAKLIRTNLTFRGVLLPAGEHEAAFRFEPLSLRLGALVSALSLLVLATLLTPGIPERIGAMMRGRGG